MTASSSKKAFEKPAYELSVSLLVSCARTEILQGLYTMDVARISLLGWNSFLWNFIPWNETKVILKIFCILF